MHQPRSWRPASCFRLPTSYFLLPASYFLLPTTSYFLLPTTCFLLPGVIDANDGARRVQAHSRESRRAPCARHTAPPRSSSNPVCAATTPSPPLHSRRRRATELAEGGGGGEGSSRGVWSDVRDEALDQLYTIAYAVSAHAAHPTSLRPARAARRRAMASGWCFADAAAHIYVCGVRGQAIRLKPARKQSGFQKLQALLIRLGVAHDSRAADATLCEGDDPLQAI
ncbi:hypothetical protein AcW1_002792 [Taiwanofungus camphoratus]|nr:hypothetical protein AcW1_002792 [Antrodia cinnamomea]